MAEEQKISEKALQTVMMETPPRLQMNMLGPVQDIAAAIPAGDKEVRIIGYVFGEARGLSYRSNPNSADGAPAVGLVGAFEGVPDYKDFPGMKEEQSAKRRARLGSGVCFLPEQMQQVVAKKVRGDQDHGDIKVAKRGERVDKLGTVVPISVEIGIRKSDSPVGYEWVCRMLVNVVEMSPLDRMRQALGLKPGDDLKQLVASGNVETHQSKALEAPAPSKSKTSAKKR